MTLAPSHLAPAANALTGMDAPRRLVLERAHSLNITLKSLSQTLGRNEAYIQQWLSRGTPRQLHENDRALLAMSLGLPEEALRGQPRSVTPNLLRQSGSSRIRSTAPPQVPVFQDTERTIEPSRTRDVVPTPSGTAAVAFALWISIPAGRLIPGDLAYVDGIRPPRLGNTVVALAGTQILAIGQLRHLTSVTAVVACEEGDTPLKREGLKVLRVSMIGCP
jgi:hypothetical protein